MENDSKQKTVTHDGVTLPLATKSEPGKKVGGYDMDAPLAKSSFKTPQKGNVFNVSNAFENPHSETGVIVNDKKRTRPSVGQSILSAFSEWWSGTETASAPKAVPAPKPEKVVPRETPVVKQVPVPKAPVQVQKQPVPKIEVPKAETYSPKITPAPQAKHDEPTTPKEPTPEKSSEKPHQVILEKFRTYKKDIERLTQKKEVVNTVTPETNPSPVVNAEVPTEPKKEAVTMVQPKAPRLGPLTVPDVRTATIAPLVTKHIDVTPEEIIKKETPVPPKPEKVVPQEMPVVTRVPVPQKIERAPEPAMEEEAPKWTSAEELAEPEVPQPIVEPLPTVPPPQPLPEAPTYTPKEPEIVVPQEMPEHEQTPFEHEPIRHEDLFPQKEAIQEYFPSEKEIPEDKKLQFRGTIDKAGFEERKKTLYKNQTKVSRNKSSANFSYFKIILGGLVLTIVLGGSGLLLIKKFQNPETTQSQEPVQGEEVLPEINPTEVELTGDTNALKFSILEQGRNAEQEIVRLYPVVTQAGVKQLVSGKEFIATLATHLPEKAVRGITDSYSIGSVRVSETKTTPFMVFHTNDFDTLFTSFLIWEPKMQDDLAPLFGDVIPPERSFADTVISNKSVRVLKDGSGNTVLVYSFITHDIVLITGTEEAFTKALGAL